MRNFIILLFFFYFSILPAQVIIDSQIDNFDFKEIDAYVNIDPVKQMVKGQINYKIDFTGTSDTLFINGKKMKFSEVELNGKSVVYSTDDEGIYILQNFQPSLNNILSLNYEVSPAQGMYFINWQLPDIPDSKKQVWTQGQGKYTSTWLPSPDDMREKAVFDLKVEFPEQFNVIANGVEKANTKVSDSTKLWEFDMVEPMSSYLLAVAAGIYDYKTTVSASNKNIQIYYSPEDSSLVESTYLYSAEIMDFMEEEIGVPYPWQNYKQIPVKDFLYAGMENTGTTIFSESLMVDKIGFHDRNYVNVNAHELAHQWFGNLITEKDGGHHWLHEGFATFYALLAEKKIFGEDYYYWKLYESAETLKKLSDHGKGESLLDPGAGSITFYQKGAWTLHILREKVGDEAFKMGIKNYLQKYAFQGVDTEEFLTEMEKASGMDLLNFRKDWLEQSAFKANQSLNSLKNSPFITSYLELAALRETPLDQKFSYLDKALGFPVNNCLGQEVVHQLSGLTSEQAMILYKKAFETNNLYVRQAIAISMQEIPPALKKDFESLLKDDSYLTIEAALYKLWEQFPQDRDKYLELTRNIDGFYEKNVRMLWLALNLVTPDFETENNQEYYEELAGYTMESYPFQVRENAFGYLFQLGAFNDSSLKSLIKATNHHTWSFRNYSRKLLSELLKNEEYRRDLLQVSSELTENETSYLRLKISG
ncbi:M1 family metallopeptidase [Christiangramia aquimixticola]|uniref:M1 family metallopeptidase n=1 Tax=Christiangramia aquimixticola TaxID=1697558 RepID=UPI003AA8C292